MQRGEALFRLNGRAAAWSAVALAALFCAPSLGLGFVADDVSHRGFALGYLADEHDSAWWDMFDSSGRTDPLQVTRMVVNG